MDAYSPRIDSAIQQLTELLARLEGGYITVYEYAISMIEVVLEATPAPDSSRARLMSEVTQRGLYNTEFLTFAVLAPGGWDRVYADFVEGEIERLVTSEQLQGDPAVAELIFSWLEQGGTIPPHLRAATETAEPLSYAAWAAFLVANLDGDVSRARAIAQADAAAGCPRSAIVHARRGDGTLLDISVESLNDAGRFGDMVDLAIYHLTQGSPSLAAEISGLIDLHRLDSLGQTSAQLQHVAAGHVRCRTTDVTLLPLLALIDLLTGHRPRAIKRAIRYLEVSVTNVDDRVDRPFAAYTAIAYWVLATTTRNPIDRLARLASQTGLEHAGPALLQAQIHSDRADTLDTLGDHTEAAQERQYVSEFLTQPDMGPVSSTFYYNDLLTALPCVARFPTDN